MKICFFTNDKLINKLSERIEGVEVTIFETMANVKTYFANNTENKVLLFMDLDIGEKAHEINREFLNHENVIRILITESISLKKLKKHQQGKESAIGYIKKPLTAELVSGLLHDFELSEYVEKNSLTHEGDKVEKDNVDLTFIGIKKPNLDDIVTEEEEEITQGHVNEFRAPTPYDDPNSDDLDIDIEDLEIDGIENENYDEMETGFSLDDSVETADKEIAEAITYEETVLLSKSGMNLDATSSCFNSSVNEKIQESFDKVFMVEQKADIGPTNEDLPVDQRESIDQTQSEISINLDGMDDDSSEASIDESTDEIRERENDETNTGLLNAGDEISLDEDKTSGTVNQIIIEAAIINNPELDGLPANSIVDKASSNESADLVYLLDEEIQSEIDIDIDIEEVSLTNINIEGVGDEVLSNDGTQIQQSEQAELSNEIEIEIIKSRFVNTYAFL